MWRLKKNDPRLTEDRAWFVARHWARQAPSGEVQLRADPKHKLKFAISYRLDETIAIWRQVRAPVLWLEGGESAIRAWLKEGPAELAARMAAFQNLRHFVVLDAGHMLHHDAPEKVAALIEDFLT